MRTNKPNGGFMLAWQKVRATYDASGTLVYAEHLTTKRYGRICPRAVKPDGPTWRYCADQGRQEMELTARFPYLARDR